MKDSFEFSPNVHNLLFYGWNSSNSAMLFGMCVVIGAIVLLLEAILLLQGYIKQKVKTYRRSPSPTSSSTPDQNVEQPALLNPLIDTVQARQMWKHRLILHVWQSLLRVLQMVLAYLVMLAIMSYNAWILVAVAIAYGVGYFFLGVFREELTTSDVNTSQSPSVPPSIPETERTLEPQVL